MPPFNTPTYRIFSLVWFAALLLAIVGPTMGLYDRYSSPANNSQLLIGSRVGIAVSPQDATRIRFPVGPASTRLRLRKGEQIIAVYGVPLPPRMPVTEKELSHHADDPAYIAMGSVLFGTDEMPVPLSVRSPDGTVRDVTITTSEDHISAAARSLGVRPLLLNFIDLVHVIFYPTLIWAAWILHRRNARDTVSSILSLAILLMIGAELPSSTFLASAGVPLSVNTALYDLGNVLLIIGILLFPYGKLDLLRIVLVGLSPLLLFLSGQTYQSWLTILLIAGVLIQVRSLRTADSNDLKQQIRWALFGFTGFALFRSVSYLADVLKWSANSFSGQLTLELGAGLSLGISVLVLQLGLLVALIRYRLYDAEVIISRTATAAIVTFGIGGTFAAVMEGIITGIQFVYPESDTSQTLAAMAGAVVAAVVIEPLHRRTREWSERRFHKALLEIRENLPDCLRELRDSASMEELLSEALRRIELGTRATQMAVIVDSRIAASRGVSIATVQRWLEGFRATQSQAESCDAADRIFPIRVPLHSRVKEGNIGWLIIGPRPDGSLLSKDEQKALVDAAGPMTQAISTITRRSDHDEFLLSRLEEQQLRIAALEELLSQKSAKAVRKRTGS